MRPRKYLFPLFLLGVFFLSDSAQASSLQKLFETLGGETNVTTPGGFQDQAAGYYTGGGIFTRQKNTTLQPINVSLPRLGAGCGGMDLFFGSLSFASAREYAELFRAMAGNIPTYAFQLALKTMAPQLENLMAQIRKHVQDMNALMLDSCYNIQNLIGSLWPKGTAASEYICAKTQQQHHDVFGARKHCQKEDVVQNAVEATKAQFPDLMQGEYNLTWHVLQKMPGYFEDKEFAAFVMTSVGTLISKKEGTRFRVHTIEGHADQKEYLNAYLKGGEVAQYVCDEPTKCLNPRLEKIIFKDEEKVHRTMKAKTLARINALYDKYINNKVLSEGERAFLNDAVNLPVYKYIQVSAAVGSTFLMGDAVEFIAVSILLTQFEKITSDIIAALDSLQHVQLESKVIETFKKRLQAMRGRLQVLLTSIDSATVWRLNQMIQSYEQVLAARNS